MTPAQARVPFEAQGKPVPLGKVMPANAAEWDAKHREAVQKPASPPAAIVMEWLERLPRGPVLDLACGTGRHALLLASRGHHVTAVDWSKTALEILEQRAREAKLPVSWATASELGSARTAAELAQGIQLIQADLEEIQLPESAFAVILCVQYLQRSLFTQISDALRPGGVLIFETFAKARQGQPGGPRNPAYLLEPNELRATFSDMETQFYREAKSGIATLVSQRSA